MNYSQRLGNISEQNFQQALNKFNLGQLATADPVPFGNFGQNVFLTTDTGEFVFRGKPHYPWQFQNEQLMTNLLHEKAAVPIAYPYLIDEDTNIFGWSYAIMPRLKGLQLADKKISATLTANNWQDIATAYAENLAAMHELTWDCSGKWTDDSDGIKPFSPNFSEWIINSINTLLAKSMANNHHTTGDDKRWVESIIKSGRDAMMVPFTPGFVMQDYQESNTLVDQINGRWQVTGVFDFMESYFGDSEADLPRMYIKMYERNKNLADIFLKAYLKQKPARDGFTQRFPVYVIVDRLLVWEWAQRTGKTWWPKDLTFKQWCEQYTQLDIS